MIEGTAEVRDVHRFDVDALERHLARHIEGFRGPLSVRQFRGGQSNPTYYLTAGGREYVLRRKPPGKLLPSAHAADREYRVLAALAAHTTVPVPKPYLLCEDDAVIGTMFYVMDCVHGRIFRDANLGGATPAERRAIYDSMNDVLARLHLVDWKAVGLAAYCRRTRRPAIEHWDFYIAFAEFRLAAIAQGIMGRVVAGTANDPNARERGERARPLAEAGWRLVESRLG